MNSSLLLLAAGAALALAAPTGAATTLYVGPKGSDANPGTAARPFATLERARDAVRAAKANGLPPGGITVEVAGGVYELARPLALTAADSGDAEHPIVWRGHKGNVVRLVGGRLVSGWQPVTDATTLARLDPAARGHVMRADLKALGITRYGELKSAPGWGSSDPGLQLFFDDKPMTLARWPNEGYTLIKDTLDHDFDVRGTRGSTRPSFYYEGDRPKRWVNEPDVMLHGWWFWDWADQRYRVKSIDADKGIVTVDAPRVEFRKDQWYYAYNILSELDTPGEWYLDRAAGMLYLWPTTAVDRGRAMVSLLPSIVTMQDVSHVTLRGFTMEGCQGTAVTIAGGTGNRVAGCTIRNTGSFAVRVEGGTDHGVVGCDMYQMGDGGVVLHGGDRNTLTHCNHFADNNHIHHFSVWNPMYKVGVEMVGVGCRASHNLVDHAPHVAISFCGQENVVEYNEIHNVVQHANDAGAIYTQPGSDETWTMRGNIVRYNYVHHVYGYLGRGCDGVYLDDMFSSIHCYGNVFYQVPYAAFVGGGRDNVFENNLFVECSPAVHVDGRGLNWAAGGEGYLKSDLASVPYQKPPWSTRYPQLLTILQDQPMAPKGNVIARNVCWKGRWDDVEGVARPFVKFEDNLVGQDPGFVGRPPADFRLRPDSPAWKIGFKPIPFEKIGLYKDEDRASWPVLHPADPAPANAMDRESPRYTTPVAVPRLDAPPTGAWSGAVLPMKETPERTPIAGAPCEAHVAHDGQRLYVSVTIPLKDPSALKPGADWGKTDGMEICFRDLSTPSQPGPIFILQAFPNGETHAPQDGGATPDEEARVKAASRCTARKTAAGWQCDWSVPLRPAGITLKPGLKLGFNVGVRRTETDEWIAWAGTMGPNWDLHRAGTLVLR